MHGLITCEVIDWYLILITVCGGGGGGAVSFAYALGWCTGYTEHRTLTVIGIFPSFAERGGGLCFVL
jgi:hypothetical protein